MDSVATARRVYLTSAFYRRGWGVSWLVRDAECASVEAITVRSTQARMPVFATDFESQFLSDVCSAFNRRSKALRYNGSLTCQVCSRDPEHIVVEHCPVGNRARVQLSLEADNLATVYVLGGTVRSGGKVYFRLEDMTLVRNGTAIVDAFEGTLPVAYHRDLEAPETLQDLRDLWHTVSLRAL